MENPHSKNPKEGSKEQPESAFEEVLDAQREKVKVAIMQVVDYLKENQLAATREETRIRLRQVTSLFVIRDILNEGKSPSNLPALVSDVVELTSVHLDAALNDTKKGELQKALDDLTEFEKALADKKDVA